MTMDEKLAQVEAQAAAKAAGAAKADTDLITGHLDVEQLKGMKMADLKARYDVAVIDECQMIADRDRGGAWTAAILGLCADEIHACASPDAEGLLTRIIQECGDELEIVGPDTRPFPIAAAGMADLEGNAIEEARTPQMQFTMQLPKQVPAHSLIRRSVDLSAK